MQRTAEAMRRRKNHNPARKKHRLQTKHTEGLFDWGQHEGRKCTRKREPLTWRNLGSA